MKTAQHGNRCPVYLHPAAATSPASIETIQRQTGLIVIINTKSRSRSTAVPAVDDIGSPWGGDAA